MNYIHWPRMRQYLLDNANAPLTMPVKIDDLTEPLSPLTSEMKRISMDPSVDVPSNQFMENITNNFSRHTFQIETWRLIKEIYDIVEENSADRSRQKALELLLIISKVDVVEFTQHVLPLLTVASPTLFSPSMADVAFFEEVLHIYYLPNFKEVAKKLLKILPVSDDVSSAIKTFLKRPAVRKALGDALKNVNISVQDDWIINRIDSMPILFSGGLRLLSGVTMRSGIVLRATEEDLQKLLSLDSDHVKERARLFCLSCHEAGHFLARCWTDDYNYSSPGKNVIDDPIPGKAFELGRYVETLLCNGIQVDWNGSKAQAATEFLTNASTSSIYPLVGPRENDGKYLIERDHPSISFASIDLGDMFDILDIGIC